MVGAAQHAQSLNKVGGAFLVGDPQSAGPTAGRKVVIATAHTKANVAVDVGPTENTPISPAAGWQRPLGQGRRPRPIAHDPDILQGSSFLGLDVDNRYGWPLGIPERYDTVDLARPIRYLNTLKANLAKISNQPTPVLFLSLLVIDLGRLHRSPPCGRYFSHLRSSDCTHLLLQPGEPEQIDGL